MYNLEVGKPLASADNECFASRCDSHKFKKAYEEPERNYEEDILHWIQEGSTHNLENMIRENLPSLSLPLPSESNSMCLSLTRQIIHHRMNWHFLSSLEIQLPRERAAAFQAQALTFKCASKETIDHVAHVLADEKDKRK